MTVKLCIEVTCDNIKHDYFIPKSVVFDISSITLDVSVIDISELSASIDVKKLPGWKKLENGKFLCPWCKE